MSNTTPNFCTRCGAPRNPSSRFCRQCGKLLANPQIPPTDRIEPPQPAKVGGAKPSRWLLIGFLLIFMVGCLIGSVVVSQQKQLKQFFGSSSQANTQQTDLIIHVIDVGQGDSILIQTPQGTTALIDGGYDNGLALEYLEQQGINTIDVMVLSHPHADHLGGLIEVMDTLEVGGVWTSGATHSTEYFEQFIDTISRQQIPYHEVKARDQIDLGDLELLVVRSEPKADNINDSSLILRLEYDQFSILLPGDAEAPSEADVIQTMPNLLPATILKLGHHGSLNASTPGFLAEVNPKVAIYSAGRANEYGHPHPQTIELLCRLGITVYGTDRHGTVVIRSDGIEYTIEPQQQTADICR